MYALFLAAILTICFCSTASAQEATRETIGEWAKANAETRKKATARLAELHTELDALSKGRINKRITMSRIVRGQWNFPSETNRADRMREKNREIAKQRARITDTPDMRIDQLVKGGIGRIRNGSDIIGTTGHAFDIVQVVDGSNVILRMFGRTIWATMPTEGMTDDVQLSADRLVFEVLGTKQYGTALGSTNTVFHVRLFDLDKALAEEEAKRDKPATADKPD